MWGTSEGKIASKIADAYSSASDPHHSTAHSIAMGESIILERLANRVQEFGLCSCIAQTYDIAFETLGE